MLDSAAMKASFASGTWKPSVLPFATKHPAAREHASHSVKMLFAPTSSSTVTYSVRHGEDEEGEWTILFCYHI